MQIKKFDLWFPIWNWFFCVPKYPLVRDLIFWLISFFLIFLFNFWLNDFSNFQVLMNLWDSIWLLWDYYRLFLHVSVVSQPNFSGSHFVVWHETLKMIQKNIKFFTDRNIRCIWKERKVLLLSIPIVLFLDWKVDITGSRNNFFQENHKKNLSLWIIFLFPPILHKVQQNLFSFPNHKFLDIIENCQRSFFIR